MNNKSVKIGQVLQENVYYYYVWVYPQDESNEVLTKFNNGYFFIHNYE